MRQQQIREKQTVAGAQTQNGVVAMNRLTGTVVAAAGILTAAEAGASIYFYRRTMKRGNAKKERTMKMAGTNWEQYFPVIEEKKQQMLFRPHEDVWIRSRDGLLLHGTFFPGEGDRSRMVICFHGYTSQGTSDFIGLSGYYLKRGFQMLLVDERAHGKSEGKYIGFGCLDRQDALQWIDWAVKQSGEDVRLLLHGISMGGATVLMTSGLELPPQVRGIVSDCAFTSPKYVFRHVLHTMYHIPAFPLLNIADRINRRQAGYGLDECNAAREVRKTRIPVLLIHGDEDTFVPCSMCTEIYENCASSDKTRLIIKGAGHAESYYKNTEAYEQALDSVTGRIML